MATTTSRRKRAEFSNDISERLPPHSEEAERGVLGCCLLSPDCISDCRAKNLTVQDFYDLRNQIIYGTLLMLEVKLETFEIDVFAIQESLKKRRFLDDIGGLAYLNSLPDATPSAANIDYFVEIVLEKSTLRKIVHACADTANKVYEHTGDVKTLVDEVQRDFEVITNREISACQRFSISDLDDFDLKNRDDVLVGNGYLMKASNLLINGASGRGKSSLLMMRMVLWVLGRDFYGQRPARPMKAVFFQAENNKRDLSRQFQGVRDYLRINIFDTPKEFQMLCDNLEFIYCPAICGPEFLQFAERELLKHPCDIAALDPLVSFAKEDLNTQKGAAEFIRQGLFKISAKTGVAWVVNHHTPKPRGGEQAFVKKLSDQQYAGAGSFDLPGAFRAVETLEELPEHGKFRLYIAKGNEAGTCHPDGTPSPILWLNHSTAGGMHWEQANPPEEPESKSEPEAPKLSKAQQIAFMNLGTFCSACRPEGEGLREIIKRLENWLAKEKKDVSTATCQRVIPLLVENGKLTKGDDGKYRKGGEA